MIQIWIVFFGGAEELEGTVASAFLLNIIAPMLSAPLLKTYVAFAWSAQLVIVLLKAFP
jgi:hypothetical protein